MREYLRSDSLLLVRIDLENIEIQRHSGVQQLYKMTKFIFSLFVRHYVRGSVCVCVRGNIPGGEEWTITLRKSPKLEGVVK